MTELKLDIGCGGRGSRQPGFIGIDVWPRPANKTPAEYHRLDFVHDKLPWADNSVDKAVALHIIEHLMPEDGHALLRRAVALLKPCAELAVSCPDLHILAAGYLRRSDLLYKKHKRKAKDIWPGATLADRLNWAIHQEGHLWSYDTESLIYHARYALGDSADVAILPADSRYWTRPDHETAILITKRK